MCRVVSLRRGDHFRDRNQQKQRGIVYGSVAAVQKLRGALQPRGRLVPFRVASQLDRVSVRISYTCATFLSSLSGGPCPT